MLYGFLLALVAAAVVAGQVIYVRRRPQHRLVLRNALLADALAFIVAGVLCMGHELAGISNQQLDQWAILGAVAGAVWLIIVSLLFIRKCREPVS